MHAEAQQNEKTTKVVDKDRYARAAEAYEFYLANFPDAADAVELRYLRADILYFKLGKYEEAGREYLAVGKTQPVGKFHKDALLQAMGAFEKVRKPSRAASARSPRAIACSARRPTSTRRCSRRTRRSSPSSTRTASSSSTTATTTRRSSASA